MSLCLLGWFLHFIQPTIIKWHVTLFLSEQTANSNQGLRFFSLSTRLISFHLQVNTVCTAVHTWQSIQFKCKVNIYLLIITLISSSMTSSSFNELPCVVLFASVHTLFIPMTFCLTTLSPMLLYYTAMKSSFEMTLIEQVGDHFGLGRASNMLIWLYLNHFTVICRRTVTYNYYLCKMFVMVYLVKQFVSCSCFETWRIIDFPSDHSDCVWLAFCCLLFLLFRLFFWKLIFSAPFCSPAGSNFLSY